jgi:hypothetical protein
MYLLSVGRIIASHWQQIYAVMGTTGTRFPATAPATLLISGILLL